MAGSGDEARHAAVVWNPTKVQRVRLQAAVDAVESDAGYGTTRWYETTAEDSGTGQARRAVADGAEVVLAAGGDGTIRAVAEGLRGSEVPMALLPSGTGNLLARNLDMNLSRLDQSVQVAFTGVDRKIDLGRMELEREDGSREAHTFVVMAGVGLDAMMIENTDPELKKKVGWIAYVGGIARSLKGSNNLRVRFRIDDEAAHTLRVNMLLVGNCGLLTGNILLLPDASVDDGVFDVVALRPEGLLGWIQIGVKVFWENGVLRRSSVGRKLLSRTHEVRTLRYTRGTTVAMRPESPQVFQLDGDAFGTAVRARASIEPLALAVRIPRDRADSLPASEEAVAAGAPSDETDDDEPDAAPTGVDRVPTEAGA